MELGKLDRKAVLASFWRGAAIRMVLCVFFPWMAVVLLAEFSVPALVVAFLIGTVILTLVRNVARV